jgi:transposase
MITLSALPFAHETISRKNHSKTAEFRRCLFVIFWAKSNTVVTPQPLYSPDMAPCDFFLFPKMKKTLKGRHFTSIYDIKSASLNELKTISKIEFEKCFKDWQKSWH